MRARMIFSRRPRLSCGGHADKPRYDCMPCQMVRLLGEAIERARMEMMLQMHSAPAWRLRDLEGRR